MTNHIRSKAVEAGFPRLATISRNEVCTILEKGRIKPFKMKYYCEKKTLNFESKMHNLLLLYKKLSIQYDAHGKLLPAEDGEYIHVLSYDEKPGIQATANASQNLPPKPGEHEAIACDYEYKRKGTISLLAAIDLQTGKAIALIRKTHKSEDYIDFLKILDSSYPRKHSICIALDNLKVHTSKKTRDYLATVPNRFQFVFTPKHGSWLNLIESFFNKLTKQMLRGIRVESQEELQKRLYKYFEEINADPVVYHWAWKLEEIDVS